MREQGKNTRSHYWTAGYQVLVTLKSAWKRPMEKDPVGNRHPKDWLIFEDHTQEQPTLSIRKSGKKKMTGGLHGRIRSSWTNWNTKTKSKEGKMQQVSWKGYRGATWIWRDDGFKVTVKWNWICPEKWKTRKYSIIAYMIKRSLGKMWAQCWTGRRPGDLEKDEVLDPLFTSKPQRSWPSCICIFNNFLFLFVHLYSWKQTKISIIMSFIIKMQCVTSRQQVSSEVLNESPNLLWILSCLASCQVNRFSAIFCVKQRNFINKCLRSSYCFCMMLLKVLRNCVHCKKKFEVCNTILRLQHISH